MDRSGWESRRISDQGDHIGICPDDWAYWVEVVATGCNRQASSLVCTSLQAVPHLWLSSIDHRSCPSTMLVGLIGYIGRIAVHVSHRRQSPVAIVR